MLFDMSIGASKSIFKEVPDFICYSILSFLVGEQGRDSPPDLKF
jgi:hypothetical protein